jgi:hypothetical protein
MDFLAIFRAPGWLFGPPSMLCAVIALVMCGLATIWWSPGKARWALIFALAPMVIVVIGLVAGAVYVAIVSNPAALAGREGLAIFGNMMAFGLVMSVLPTAWAILLRLRHRRAMA